MSGRSAPSPLHHLRLVAAVCVGSGLAHFGTSAMPLQVSALMDGAGRTAPQAGVIGALEIGALALAMGAVSPVLGRLSPRRIASLGCGAAALGNLLLYLGRGSLALQWGGAVIAGAGFGLVFAATVAGAAGARDPDRLYGVGNSGALLIIAGVMSLVPALASRLGGLGVFAALAMLALACTPLLAGLDRPGRIDAARSSAIRIRGAPELLVTWATFSCGTAALYAFADRIGRQIGLSPQTIAATLSLGTFTGLIGTGLAAILGSRLDRRIALVASLLLSALSCLLIGHAAGLVVFAAGVFLYWVSSMFAYSYLQGTAAALDPSGSLGALAGGCERLSFAAGAALGGYVFEHTTGRALGALGSIGCVLGLALGYQGLTHALNASAATSSASDRSNVHKEA